MKYETLGSSSLQISRIVHGCMELGGGRGTCGRTRRTPPLRAALEHGVTAFDTAESYGGGHSEEVVGAALAPVRDKVVLCTKVSKEHLRKADVLAACEGSLRRLKTDYIDLYYVHWPNPDIDIGETMEAFNLLKAQGKIRAIGVSNFSVEQMRAAQRYAKLDALQPEYNLLCRGIEADVLPYCRENGISILTYNSIAKGILSGAFHLGGARVTDFRTAKPLFQEAALAEELPLIELLRDIAQAHSVSLAQVAIAAQPRAPGRDRDDRGHAEPRALPGQHPGRGPLPFRGGAARHRRDERPRAPRAGALTAKKYGPAALRQVRLRFGLCQLVCEEGHRHGVDVLVVVLRIGLRREEFLHAVAVDLVVFCQNLDEQRNLLPGHDVHRLREDGGRDGHVRKVVHRVLVLQGAGSALALHGEADLVPGAGPGRARCAPRPRRRRSCRRQTTARRRFRPARTARRSRS